MAAQKLLIVGSGGHAKSVTETAIAAGYLPVGTLAPRGSQTLFDLPYLGDDTQAGDLFAQGFKVAFVAIGENSLRLQLGRRLMKIGFKCPTIVHPAAIVSPRARLDCGVLVMPHAVIGADAAIGAFAIVNTAAVVEHDCEVGEGAHLAPRSALGGAVRVGACTLMGVGSVARPGAVIGSNVTVGAGAAVVADLADGTVAFGVPAKERPR